MSLQKIFTIHIPEKDLYLQCNNMKISLIKLKMNPKLNGKNLEHSFYQRYVNDNKFMGKNAEGNLFSCK